MNILKLDYTSDHEFDLNIFLGEKKLTYTKSNTTIEIPCELTQGFHLLKIQLLSKAKVTFTAGYLDGQSFRHTIYAMYAEKGHIQTTELTGDRDTVLLPFMNPLIWWITACLERIPNKLFGGQLYEKMSVYYPQAVQLDDKYPTELKDYFYYNRDFHVHPKYTLQEAYFKHEVPFFPIGNLITYDEESMVQELFDNLDFLNSLIKEYYGQRESDKTLGQGTRFVSLYDNIQSESDDYDPKNDFMLDPDQFPKMLEFFKNLPIQKVFHSMLGVLGPGQVIMPHVDKYTGHEHFIEQYGGCSQIYIPLNFKPGNYFKITNVGLVPTDQGAVLINNHDLTHAIVNNSNEYRFAILIVGTRLLNA